MTTHGSATTQQETTISDALRHRAQTVITNQAIDPRWRTIIRYAMETNDTFACCPFSNLLSKTFRHLNDHSVSVDQLLSSAAAEKLSALMTVECFTSIVRDEIRI